MIKRYGYAVFSMKSASEHRMNISIIKIDICSTYYLEL